MRLRNFPFWQLSVWFLIDNLWSPATEASVFTLIGTSSKFLTRKWEKKEWRAKNWFCSLKSKASLHKTLWERLSSRLKQISKTKVEKNGGAHSHLNLSSKHLRYSDINLSFKPSQARGRPCLKSQLSTSIAWIQWSVTLISLIVLLERTYWTP